ncbi:MAG TPA: acyl-CoA synthetase [Acidimicrobiales bacterium]|nr:acyl-CoA synthetase [Acidimicrobiales bacterium]
MDDWNFADVWETVAEVVPEAPALVQGERHLRWAEVDRRSNALARALLEVGSKSQDKVAQYLYNCPEYLESVFAAFKAGLVPVNTNYRYTDDELVYLWDNADVTAVVFHGAFAERIDGMRRRVPRVSSWIWVDDGNGPRPQWALDYGELVAGEADRQHPPWNRSGDDLLLLYTGGTTGMPKGVMWRQDDLFRRLNAGNLIRIPEDDGLHGVRKTLVGSGPSIIPACPLMHGTGLFTAMGTMSVGGCVVTLANRHFDPVELLQTVERENVNVLSIVGDAFAKPILAALDSQPGAYSLSTLLAILSSGVMWSEETKLGLLRHHPTMMLIDAFSSSEALGMGASVSTANEAKSTAHFSLGPEVRVIDTETGKDVEPGSGRRGVLALGGRNPLGYYKDPEKTSATFRLIDGVRYSVPGDYAVVEPDGSILLLGRGSVVVNTGGEKVFPEEVEESLKLHEAVSDAVVVGVPDERFGEMVTAAVERRPGAEATEAELIDFVRQRLAAYKAPRHIRFVSSVGRAPSGKLDYGRQRAEMIEWLGGSRTSSASEQVGS